ncbi:hypothetical protein NQ318_022654 [Aromia moschata]|uniref:Uncharacterized protein n=1 Tax=Aromia moschata TaxID=1265417 RepID=A0AAV8YKD7_9CUCU|nr:hypothetical protein NQ318_022654 [Aromia moschata]
MSCKVCLVLACILAFTAQVYNKPVIRSGVRQCFKQECPENTYACVKFSKVSDDKSSIIHQIRCLGGHDNSLKNYTTYEANPFGRSTFYQGYSYSGVYNIVEDSSPSHHVEDSDEYSNNGEVDTINVETF